LYIFILINGIQSKSHEFLENFLMMLTMRSTVLIMINIFVEWGRSNWNILYGRKTQSRLNSCWREM